VTARRTAAKIRTDRAALQAEVQAVLAVPMPASPRGTWTGGKRPQQAELELDLGLGLEFELSAR
jgi:hypothetical protein